jgi:hypothetical protein
VDADRQALMTGQARLDRWWAAARDWFLGEDIPALRQFWQRVDADDSQAALRLLAEDKASAVMVCNLASLAMSELTVRYEMERPGRSTGGR